MEVMWGSNDLYPEVLYEDITMLRTFTSLLFFITAVSVDFCTFDKTYRERLYFFH